MSSEYLNKLKDPNRCLEFDVLREEELLHKVKILFNQNRVEIETFTDIPLLMEFGKDLLTLEEILDWLETRCFERHRANAKELLAMFGLTLYNPYDIVAITHGIMAHDKRWIRFKGEEELTYEEALRRYRGR